MAADDSSTCALPLLNRPAYTHGAYYGYCAGLAQLHSMVSKVNAAELQQPPLRHLEQLLASAASGSPPRFAMAALRNSPVMAAIGHVLELMRQKHDTMFLSTIYRAVVTTPSAPRPIEWDLVVKVPEPADTATDADTDIATDTATATATTPATPATNITPTTHRWLANTIVVHGNVMESLKELFGYSMFDSVSKRAPNALNWLLTYVQVILSFIDPNIADPTTALWQAKVPTLTISDLPTYFHQIWPKMFATSADANPTFSLVLDIKSRHLTPSHIQCLVSSLNELSILVEGVGSFKFAQLHAAPDSFEHKQLVRGAPSPPPTLPALSARGG